MDQLEADAVRMESKSTGDTAVMDKAIESSGFESNILSVDQYAEQLMDNLFEGIERSLETGEVLEEEVAPDPIQTLKEASAAPLSVIAAPDDHLPEAVVEPSQEEPEASSSDTTATAPQPDWSLRILWAAALLSCAGAIALCISNWSSYKALFQQLTGQAPAPEVVAAVPADMPNQAFASYIQQSLEALATQQPAVATATGLATPVAPTAVQAPLPATTTPLAATVPGGLAPTTVAAQPTTILERVYIPVYQTPQGFVPVVPGVPAPNVTAGLPTGGTVLPVQPPVTTAGQPGIAIAPSTSATGATAVPPVANADQASAGTAIAAQPIATTEHTLVGLLELGDSSAALFEVSGVTRRFSLGERIGSSGWTLVEVENSEAIVRRNGELRSIFVGQTF